MEEVIANTNSGSYKIQIGNQALLKSKELKDIIAEGEVKALMLSNYLYDLHYEYLGDVLAMHPNRAMFLVQDSEENKNYEYAGTFLQKFADVGLERKSCVWAIGGGVIGDFAGYCAALYMRGIPVVQCPTTLLAMVDASIGGKVAVNLGKGKNMAGAFHMPTLVVADLFFLQTLGQEEIKCGLAEILKHGLLGDKPTLDILQKENITSVQREEVLSRLIYHSASFKADIVSRDETEIGLRAILNLGHTVAHGIESALEYKGVTHGEAVAIGLLAESRMSARMGLLPKEDLQTTEDLLNKYKLVNLNIKLDGETVIRHMGFDKKNRDGAMRFALLKKIWEPVYDAVVPDEIIRVEIENIFKA